MPLPNTASLQDVIEKLEELQGMNQKAELASVIGSPAVSTDNIADQILKLQDVKETMSEKLSLPVTTPMQEMADSITEGKKWASGNIISPESPVGFTTVSGATTNAYKIEVSGLSFKPSYVIIHGVGANYAVSCYRKSISNEYTDVVTYATSNVSSGTTVSTSIRADVSPSYVNSTGFALPINVPQSSQVSWIAFE